MATLKDLLGLVKELPEEAFAEAFEKLEEIKKTTQEALASAPMTCPHCGDSRCVRNGKNRNRQVFLCRGCKKTFFESSTSAIANSHSSASVWKAVIDDTVRGVSLDETAASLDLTHQTVFNMRHKILYTVEQAILANPVMLEGACQVDETYVLESEKGREFPFYHHREPRTNGKAQKPGLSNEYICLCTGFTSEGKMIARAVNRATPSKEEIEAVFGNRIEDDTILLVDGNKSYSTLKDRCPVIRVENEDKIELNRFHSYIKERLRKYRGVATTYLNRYAALFSETFGKPNEASDKIYDLMTKRNKSFSPLKTIMSENLTSL